MESNLVIVEDNLALSMFIRIVRPDVPEHQVKSELETHHNIEKTT